MMLDLFRLRLRQMLEYISRGRVVPFAEAPGLRIVQNDLNARADLVAGHRLVIPACKMVLHVIGIDLGDGQRRDGAALQEGPAIGFGFSAFKSTFPAIRRAGHPCRVSALHGQPIALYELCHHVPEELTSALYGLGVGLQVVRARRSTVRPLRRSVACSSRLMR